MQGFSAATVAPVLALLPLADAAPISPIHIHARFGIGSLNTVRLVLRALTKRGIASSVLAKRPGLRQEVRLYRRARVLGR
jgi:hypothetical protein